MGKRLTLLRHAKSGWGKAGEPDHNRVLSDKGQQHALSLGRLLQEQQLQPDRIICSSALRAVQTANLICRAMTAVDIDTNNTLYLAAPEALLDLAAAEYDGNYHLMLIAHNPGMTELVNQLSNVTLDNLPTCG
ncbi:MAG: histidine phosphatase family protein, partial [Gammaproteobacteria bacterium]|nr:histidine phosphatase family protein [Gammaproteobacteria bacterium]